MGRCIVVVGVVLSASAAVEGTGDSDARVVSEFPQLRIDTELFVNGRKQRVAPRSLFDSGRVYDYLEGPEEVTIFEPAEQRFTMYHSRKNVACRVSFLQIEEHLDQLRARALEAVEQIEGQTSELAERVRWHWEPTFQEIYDPQIGELKLKSRFATYTIRGVPVGRLGERSGETESTGDLIAALRSYWDWYARLNVRLNPQALPPAARLLVNARLVEHGLVPEEVELRLLFGQEATVRTTHKTTVGLRRDDRRWLEETRQGLSGARMVSLEEYLVETSDGRR